MFLSKYNLAMKLNIMPKLYIIKILHYLNKSSYKKNDDPQQSFETLCLINEFFFLFLLKWNLSHAIFLMHLIYLKSVML
jgi:hypothetical protein